MEDKCDCACCSRHEANRAAERQELKRLRRVRLAAERLAHDARRQDQGIKVARGGKVVF